MNTNVLGYKWFIEAKDITGRCEKKKKIICKPPYRSYGIFHRDIQALLASLSSFLCSALVFFR